MNVVIRILVATVLAGLLVSAAIVTLWVALSLMGWLWT